MERSCLLPFLPVDCPHHPGGQAAQMEVPVVWPSPMGCSSSQKTSLGHHRQEKVEELIKNLQKEISLWKVMVQVLFLVLKGVALHFAVRTQVSNQIDVKSGAKDAGGPVGSPTESS